MPKRLMPLSLLVTLVSCTNPTPATPVNVYVAIDTSGSARPDLASYIATTSMVAQKLDPSRDRLTLYRFDHLAAEVYDGQRPKLLEAFEIKLANELAREADRKGTLPAKALKAIADAVVRSPHPIPKVVILLTDGGNDDLRATSIHSSHQAAQRLADDASVLKVIIAGVRTGMRESVRNHFSPLQNKLVLTELESVASEVR